MGPEEGGAGHILHAGWHSRLCKLLGRDVRKNVVYETVGHVAQHPTDKGFRYWNVFLCAVILNTTNTSRTPSMLYKAASGPLLQTSSPAKRG